MSLHIDSAEGTGRTKVLAGTATDTLLLIHNGNQQQALTRNLLIVGIQPASSVLMHTSLQGNHLDSSGRTMAGTVATGYAVGNRNTVVFQPYGMTHLRSCALFYGNGLNSTRRTDVAATGTFGSAVTALEAHLGLHKAIQTVAGTQHIVRAAVDTQLTGGAVFRQIPYRFRTRRGNQLFSLGLLLILNLGQSAIGGLLLGLHQRSAGQQSHTRQDGTTTFVNSRIFQLLVRLWLFAALLLLPIVIYNVFLVYHGFVAERKGTKLTFLQTVASDHTARVVYRMVLKVDTGRLAVTLTLAAVLAGLGIYHHLQT